MTWRCAVLWDVGSLASVAAHLPSRAHVTPARPEVVRLNLIAGTSGDTFDLVRIQRQSTATFQEVPPLVQLLGIRSLAVLG